MLSSIIWLDNSLPLTCMRHFRMKLKAVEAALFVGHPCKRRIVRFADGVKSGRQFLHAVAVTHPDIQEPVPVGAGVVLDIAQQPGVVAGSDLGITVFVSVR